jgi:hypothetical protein
MTGAVFLGIYICVVAILWRIAIDDGYLRRYVQFLLFMFGFPGSLKAFVEEASQESYAPEDIWPRELAGVLQRVHPRFPPNERQLEQAYELAEALDGIGSFNGWMGTLVRKSWRYSL